MLVLHTIGHALEVILEMKDVEK